MFLCAELGVPLANEKTKGSFLKLTFLWMTLDSVQQSLNLPLSKLVAINNMLTEWSTESDRSLIELQSLIGALQFAVKWIVAGRLYTRRLNDVVELPTFFTLVEQELKIFGISWWKNFLPKWSKIAKFLQPN